jgi:hypothetical protein
MRKRLSAYSNQRTKDNGFEGKYSCKCKQSIHFGFNVSSAKLENGIEINLVGEITSVP